MVWIALLASAMTSLPAWAEGAFAQLYAARPPAGSSFVRVLNPDTKPLRVKIGNGPEQTLSGDTVASAYAIVKGNSDFTITLNGKTTKAIKVPPDRFTSYWPISATDPTDLRASDDSAGAAQDALKAELRFYNLTRDCNEAKMGIAPSGAPLFAPIASGTSIARAINPVKANLVGGCGTASTAALELPALQPGDHFSLFMRGTAAAPALSGQRSATETYKP